MAPARQRASTTPTPNGSLPLVKGAPTVTGHVQDALSTPRSPALQAWRMADDHMATGQG
jgi:hypothetical protein